MNVTINGHGLWEYGAKMQAPKIQSNEIQTSVFQALNRSSMNLLQNIRGSKKMNCMIDFYGDAFTRTMNRSNFEALFLGTDPVIIDICDGFWYRAILLQASYEETVSDLISTCSYEFLITRHRGSEVVINTITDFVEFDCRSNVAKTDCTIEVDVQKSADYWTIISLNGIEWKLPPNKEGTLVMDGVRKIFFFNGVNATNQIGWTDFPFLVPGRNQIIQQAGGIPAHSSVTIRYTPTYM